jgi:hypothetical protein
VVETPAEREARELVEAREKLKLTGDEFDHVRAMALRQDVHGIVKFFAGLDKKHADAAEAEKNKEVVTETKPEATSKPEPEPETETEAGKNA